MKKNGWDNLTVTAKSQVSSRGKVEAVHEDFALAAPVLREGGRQARHGGTRSSPGIFWFFFGLVSIFFMICFLCYKKNEYGTPKMEIWKIKLVFNGMIFRFHVNFGSVILRGVLFISFKSLNLETSSERCVRTDLTLCRSS